MRFIVIAMALFAVAILLMRTRKPLHFIFKWRYVIALVLLAIGVIFQFSGSSIGLLSLGFGDPNDALSNSGVIFGMNRSIRSDEWLVLTPYFLSQDAAGYPFVSDIIRGTDTITGLVYATPSWHLVTVFHPFMLGFLVFGASRGLAFFWVGRFIALFLVTFELGRLMTRDNRYLSATLAILVTLSPFIQWWYAAANVAEMFIFGQLLVILLDRFLNCNTVPAKFALAFVMSWAAGCFIMVIYPAWQVPFFFIYAGMGIWIGIRYWKKKKRCQAKVESAPSNGQESALSDRASVGALTRRPHAVVPLPYSVISLVLAVVALIGCLAFIFWDARELISATMNTVYPGARFETGGGWGRYLFDGSVAFSLPFDLIGSWRDNVCEAATFIGLFPLGTLLGIVMAFGRRDPLSIILLIIECFLLLFAVIGIPPFLARITLMSNVAIFRVVGVITYIDVLLLIRALALRSLRFSFGSYALGRAFTRTILPQWTITAIALLGILIAIIAPFALGELTPANGIKLFTINFVGVLLVGGSILYALLYPLSRRALLSLLIGVVCSVGIAGFCVNPLRSGLGEVEQNQALHQVKQIVEEDPAALWMSESSFDSQALITVGARAINSVNAYPAMDRWALIDESGKYADVYNRFAHIQVEFQNDDPTSFEMINKADSFMMHLNVDDLKKLDVTYILSRTDLQELTTEETSFDRVEETSAGTIYKVVRTT